MKCSVLHCKNKSNNNPDGVSFHGFPTQPDVLHAWMAATGRFNLVPNFSSAICSKHFEKSKFITPRKLKPNSIPTLFLASAPKLKAIQDRSNALSCILNPDTSMNKVQLVRECASENMNTVSRTSSTQSLAVSQSHKPVNIVSSTREHIISPSSSKPSDTIILNYNHHKTLTSSTCFLPMQINVPVQFVQMPEKQVTGKSKSSVVALPTSHFPHPQKSITLVEGHRLSSECPIKLVDVNKLLQVPPAEDTCNTSSNSPQLQESSIKKLFVASEKKVTTSPKENPNKFKTPDNKLSNVNKFTIKRNSPEDFSKVTVSHVLDCLRVILPGKFDFSRLIPNEKVAALVIRYLKLVDNSASQNIIRMNLKIVIDAAKTKGKVFGDDLFHPYLKITDKALELALTKLLPADFSIANVTNEILNCLCIILKKDIYTDGYHILRKKIHKFSHERLKFNKTTKQKIEKDKLIVGENENIAYTKSDTPNSNTHTHPTTMGKKQNPIADKQSEIRTSNNKTCIQSNQHNLLNDKIKLDESSSDSDRSATIMVDNSENRKSLRKRVASKRIVYFGENKSSDSDYEPLSDSESDDCELPGYTKKTALKPSSTQNKAVSKKHNKQKENEESHFNSKTPNTPSNNKPELKGLMNLEAIIQYLDDNKCSAKDVLVNFKLMFYLCKYLRIRSRQSNLQKLKTILSLIVKKNVDKTNVKQLKEELYPTLRPFKDLNNPIADARNQGDDKLMLNPVVVLHNLADYSKEQMLFMRKKLHKSNEYHNQRIPFCFQNTSVQRYSSEYVRKLTDESYKVFRKIIMKRDGNKVVFRLKYARLVRGSVVFVKDFKNPSLGWVKASINKVEVPLRYLVQLKNGETWWCAPEQLRPLLATETINKGLNLNQRTQRRVKPKQLFDL